MIGKTLAHYEITRAIGKGGMGEVYQATDTKLGRSVAIKVLPEEFASDAERVARFEREAKLLASLNHPNIAAIYGLEQSEGTRFLVLELVEGQTLSERLVRGPLPVQESLELALQIAEALEAAHEKGVIHRDLKPANIKVTSEGKVKVLDFGLAKAYAGTAMGDETVLETLAENAESAKGVLLGTPAYMSPEQARRQPADHRSDVWAFGCVLFEMLTGRTPFKGNTLSDTIAAILEREPNLADLPRHLNPGIRRLLERCLDKNPKRRWHAIADVRLEIEETLSSPAGALGEATPQRRHLLPYAATLAMAVVVAAVGGWYLKPPVPTEPSPMTRFHLELPDDQAFGPSLTLPVLTVSPDGTQIVYVANGQLHVWDLGRDAVTPIAGTNGAQDPFFSPDGRWIAYFSGATRELRKVAIEGGAPEALTEAPRYNMGSWLDSDAVLYGDRGGILRVSAGGGTPELLIPAREGEFLGVPQMLSDGKSVLFGRYHGFEPALRIVQSVGSDERTVLFEGGIDARYAPTGHLVYGRGGELVAVPFDVDDLELRGTPMSVMKEVFTTSSVHASFGASGTLAYLPGHWTGQTSSVQWVSLDGEVTTLLDGPQTYRRSVSSPDGRRIAALADGEDGRSRSIWVYDVETGTPVQLTDEDQPVLALAWSADGERVTYAIEERIYWQKADGSEPPQLLWEHEQRVLETNWSADGRFMVFTSGLRGQGTVWVFSVEEGSAKSQTENAGAANFSPDGRWISYLRVTDDGNQLWVTPFPGPGSGRLVYTANGPQGGWNTWSQDGNRLYFRGVGPDYQKMMAVTVQTQPDFRRGEVQTLFELPFDFRVDGFDPEHERFLIIPGGATGALATPRRINVVQNWFEELKEKVPVP